MTRARRLLWWCGLLLCLVGGAAFPSAHEFQTVEIEGLRITIDSDWAPRSAPGYLPVRFDITNLGEARVIEIVGSGSRFFRYPGGTGQSITRQTVALAKGDRVHLTIPIPIFAESESVRFEIQENDKTLQRFGYQSFGARANLTEASVLLVADAASPFGSAAPRLARVVSTGGRGGVLPAGTTALLGGQIVDVSGAVSVTVGGSGRRTGAPMIDFLLEPARLPSNWIGLTSLRAVVIGKTEFAQLSDAQKTALLAWTAAGGDLIFVDGEMATLAPSLKGEASTSPGRTVARYFFGRVHALTTASLESAGLNDTLKAVGGARDPFFALPANAAPDWGKIEARGFRLRIPGIDGVPARVYLGILALFSLLIGPANYWWLRRRKQLVLMVLTVPLIAAIFIALLAGYAVAGEGFGIEGRAVTFTVLDQSAKQAATHASVSLYAAGMTPSGGLRFARDVAVYPIGPDGNGTRDTVVLDLTETQQFAGGVVHARSPTNLEEVTVRAARERLTFTRDAGGVTVANGLEAPVVGLLYKEGETTYALTGGLAVGAQQKLKVAAVDAGLAALTLPPNYAIPAKLVDLFTHQSSGSYIAILDHSPFWDPGVGGVTERGSLHVVLGWPEGQR